MSLQQDNKTNFSVLAHTSPSMDNDHQNTISTLIFSDCSFVIHQKFPANHRSILTKIIVQNGGRVENSRMDSVYEHSYFVIPSDCPLDSFDDLPGIADDDDGIVTEFFVERCLYYQKLLDPIDSWSRPFLNTLDFQVLFSPKLLHHDVSSSSFLNVTITGFSGVELLHLTKILNFLKPMGIHYAEYLNMSTDILLINLAA